VTEPEGDDAGVDPGVQQPHRGGVPQDVRADLFSVQRRAAGRGVDGVVGEAMFDGVAAERGAAMGREQRRAGGAVGFAEPVAQDGDGGAGERGDSVFAAFAVNGLALGSQQDAVALEAVDL